MPRGVALLGVVTLGLLAAGSSSVPAREIVGDAFLCDDARAARAAPGKPPLPFFHPRVGVSAVDRYTLPLASERYTLDLAKAEAFCRPVRLDAEEPTDPLSGLELYAARRTRRKPSLPPLPPVTEGIDTSLGAVLLKIGGVDALQVPTLATGSVGGLDPDRDHYACYQVRQERGTGERRGVVRLEVRSDAGPMALELRKPARLCVPANVRNDDPGAPKHARDLLCWDARVPRGTRRAATTGIEADDLLATRNGFGNELLRMGSTRALCVPAVRADVAAPTPTPLPTFTPLPSPVRTPRPARLRVEPPSATSLVRDRACFAVFLELPDDTTADVTASALWDVADVTIAQPSVFLEGKRCFVGLGIGTTSLTAREPVTGLTAPATFSADWPIYALDVQPDQLGLRTGGAGTLTVTAMLTQNRTRNVTQHVQYVSDDPTIARAPNAVGNRSRIEGVGSGRVWVTVTDTLSSISDTARVSVGALESVNIVPNTPPLFPGEHVSLQTTGVFDAGFFGNLTQESSYESSDPSIVVATNAPGDRSRIEALVPGAATITATDLQSGMRSLCCGKIRVMGASLSLGLTPLAAEHRIGPGEPPVRFKARGLFVVPPNDSVDRDASAYVTWSSSDETVLVPDQVDGEGYERFRPLAGGAVTIFATDSTSGVVASAPVVVFDRLDRVEVGTSTSDPGELLDRDIAVDELASYVAHGYFDDGRHRVLDDVRWVVSDPTVAQWIGGGLVRASRPGTVTVSAVDERSGLSSADGGRSATLQVHSQYDRLVLAPRLVSMDVGQSRYLTAIGYSADEPKKNLTRVVVYTSSDPAVVEAPNLPGNESGIVARGAGTATISARDPATGLASSTNGDDVVVTVREPDRLVSLAVAPRNRRVAVGASPHFTATASYTSGTTLNVTQKVQWLSSDPSVVGTDRYSGDRSRVDALAPGTVTIMARDLASGIASTASNEDATMTVVAIETLVLSPATLTLQVGDVFSLTTVGTAAGVDPVNVTQEAFYTSSDPTIAHPTNEAGNRSRIEALAPGTVTITAFRSSAYAQATDSNAITVTVVDAP